MPRQFGLRLYSGNPIVFQFDAHEQRAGDLVDQLHHRGDRGVELEARLDVAGRLVNRPVRLGEQLARLPLRRVAGFTRLGSLGHLSAEAPEPGEKAEHHVRAVLVDDPERRGVARPSSVETVEIEGATGLTVVHRASGYRGKVVRMELGGVPLAQQEP